MILSKEVEIRITPSNIKHFNSLGYKNLKCKNKLTVPVEHLSKGSYAIIHVKCDCCNKERYMKYINYSTNIENQGFYACRKCFNIKNKKTNFKKYGDEHYTNREKAKKTNLEINGDEYYNNMKKMKQTNKERFGVEYSLQSKEVREKVKQTNIKKYGCENPFQNKEIKEKIKRINKERLGVEYPTQNENVKEKVKQTNMKNLGCENPGQNEIIKEKARQTNIKNLGCENSFQNEEIKKKIKLTNIKKFGCESPIQNEKIKEQIKQTNIKKYGCDNPSQNKEVKEKKKQTSLKNFGVKNPMQNPNIFIKSQKSALQRKEHKETGLSYQGTYEKDFLDYCFDNSISIEKGKRIKYIYDGKEHYYFSDFYYEPKNLIVEIKSSWTYSKNKDVNEIKKLATETFGYSYMFIINKNYNNFKELIND